MLSREIFEANTTSLRSLVYSVARCLRCAKRAKEEDDKDEDVDRKKTLGAYRAGVSSAAERDTFGEQEIVARRHPRVSEDEHHAHRLEVLADAETGEVKLIAVPLRRVWNHPLPTMSETPAQRFPGHVDGASDVQVDIIARSRSEHDLLEMLLESKSSTEIVTEDTCAKETETCDSEFLSLIQFLRVEEKESQPEIQTIGIQSSSYVNSKSRCGTSNPLGNMSIKDTKTPLSPQTATFFKHPSNKDTLLPTKRHGKISTSAPASLARTFLPRLIRSSKRKRRNSASPDLACQTSLAISSGSMTMDEATSALMQQIRLGPTDCSKSCHRQAHSIPASTNGMEVRDISPLEGRKHLSAPEASTKDQGVQPVRRRADSMITMGWHGENKVKTFIGKEVSECGGVGKVDLNKRLPALPLEEDAGGSWL